MKKIILFIAFTGLILSINAQDYCDTLKWKTITTVYGNVNEGYYRPIADLDGAEIDLDEFPVLSPGIEIVNISNDVFSSDEIYLILMFYFAYADTGLLASNFATKEISINKEILPNETVNMGFSPTIDLLSLINDIKDVHNVEFEQISYWKLIIGMGAAIKDGYYSEKVFYEGADTSTFRVIRDDVRTKEIEEKQTGVSVFPNPADNTVFIELGKMSETPVHYQLYDIQGKQLQSGNFETQQHELDIASLSKGIYFISLNIDNHSKTTRKVIKK